MNGVKNPDAGLNRGFETLQAAPRRDLCLKTDPLDR
jgi:hypothetical protein